MTKAQLIAESKEKKDEYGCLLNSKTLFKKLFPKVEIIEDAPGCHAGCRQGLSGNRLTLPGGRYSSNKHYHTAGWGIADVESGYKKLNCAPLVLLRTYIYNGDYRSVQTFHYIFGKNEDGSYFLHRIRPKYGETLDAARAWMWSVRGDEKIAGRQGDLALIPKKKMQGEKVGDKKYQIGNHELWAGKITRTSGGKLYAENPVLLHGEHREVAMEGTYELRMAKVWGNGVGD